MKQRIWMWNYVDKVTLAKFIFDFISPEQLIVIRSGELDAFDADIERDVVVRKEIEAGYTLVGTRSLPALIQVLALVDWNLDMFILPLDAPDSVENFASTYSYTDSRWLSISSMTKEAIAAISKWRYSIWMSFGAIDAKDVCMIRCIDDSLAITLSVALAENSCHMGLRDDLIAAKLKPNESVEIFDIPKGYEL